MFWNPHYMNGWGWFVMSLSTILIWGLLIAAGALLFRAVQHGSGQRPVVPRVEPEQLLAERFARGEVDEDEYRRRLAVLRAESRDGAGRLP